MQSTSKETKGSKKSESDSYEAECPICGKNVFRDEWAFGWHIECHIHKDLGEIDNSQNFFS